MSTESIAWRAPQVTAGRPLVEQLHDWLITVDHKQLGVLYILYALFFLAIGGVEATILRIQLVRPHNNFLSPQVFNRMFTMHGTTMIFFVNNPADADRCSLAVRYAVECILSIMILLWGMIWDTKTERYGRSSRRLSSSSQL